MNVLKFIIVFITAATLSILVTSPKAITPPPGIEVANVKMIGPVDKSKLGSILDLQRIANSGQYASVNITINSPGGYVDIGMEYLKAMQLVKSKGVIINCYVEGKSAMAASMAFVILSTCNNRYVQSDAILLTHYAAYNGWNSRLDKNVAKQLYDSLIGSDVELERLIRSSFRVSDRVWTTLNTDEAYMSPREANTHSPKFVQCINKRRKVIDCGKK